MKHLNERRKVALANLETQLSRGVKSQRINKGNKYEEVPLTDKDIIRIEKEIAILKKRLNT